MLLARFDSSSSFWVVHSLIRLLCSVRPSGLGPLRVFRAICNLNIKSSWNESLRSEYFPPRIESLRAARASDVIVFRGG